jgi:hypothetical protein
VGDAILRGHGLEGGALAVLLPLPVGLPDARGGEGLVAREAAVARLDTRHFVLFLNWIKRAPPERHHTRATPCNMLRRDLEVPVFRPTEAEVRASPHLHCLPSWRTSVCTRCKPLLQDTRAPKGYTSATS